MVKRYYTKQLYYTSIIKDREQILSNDAGPRICSPVLLLGLLGAVHCMFTVPLEQCAWPK